MDRDAVKEMGDHQGSPVSSSRRNLADLARSTWLRIKEDMHYHPYKPIKRHKLKTADLPRRRAFCQWILTRTDGELMQL